MLLHAVLAVLGASAPAGETAYPLFAIANSRNAADWTAADIARTAGAFRLADGVPVDPELLSKLGKASPSFRAVRYCNPRGIALSGPVVGRIMPLEEFETKHRAEATFFTAGFLAAPLRAASTTLPLAHPLDALRGGENRSENHCALRDWLLVASDPRSGNVSKLVDPDGSSARAVARRCGAELRAACGEACHVADPQCSFACVQCAGDHQAALQAAGCDNEAIVAFCAGAAPSKPQAGGGGAKKEAAFVAYLLVGEELMKIDAIAGDSSRQQSEPPFDTHPPQPASVRVQRGLAGTKVVAHPAGTRVLAPVTLDDGLSSSNTRLQWAVSMSSPLAHELLANYTVSDLEAGLGGSWYDNFGAALFNSKTSTGCGLRTHELFDATKGVKWDRPSWLQAQAARFAAGKAAARAATGGKTPVIVANGYGNVAVPDGSCDVGGACASLSDMEAVFADGAFVDGWILEGFFGK